MQQQWQIAFEAVCGNGILGDIALDDFSVSTTGCQSNFTGIWKMILNSQLQSLFKIPAMKTVIGLLSNFMCLYLNDFLNSITHVIFK